MTTPPRRSVVVVLDELDDVVELAGMTPGCGIGVVPAGGGDAAAVYARMPFEHAPLNV